MLTALAGRTLRTCLIAALALIVVAIGAGAYVLHVILSENLSFRLGDVAYYLVVATSRTVRDFPMFPASDRPVEFTYSARDGTSPGQITMTYVSAAVAEDLERDHRAYCEGRSYPSVPEGGLFLASRLGCEAPDYRIEVGLSPRDTGTLVSVDFLER